MKNLLAVLILFTLVASVCMGALSFEEILLHPVTRYVLAGYFIINAYNLATLRPFWFVVPMEWASGLSVGPFILMKDYEWTEYNWNSTYAHETIHAVQYATGMYAGWGFRTGTFSPEADIVLSAFCSAFNTPVLYNIATVSGLITEGGYWPSWAVNPFEQMAVRYQLKLSAELFGEEFGL